MLRWSTGHCIVRRQHIFQHVDYLCTNFLLPQTLRHMNIFLVSFSLLSYANRVNVQEIFLLSHFTFHFILSLQIFHFSLSLFIVSSELKKHFRSLFFHKSNKPASERRAKRRKFIYISSFVATQTLWNLFTFHRVFFASSYPWLKGRRSETESCLCMLLVWMNGDDRCQSKERRRWRWRRRKRFEGEIEDGKSPFVLFLFFWPLQVLEMIQQQQQHDNWMSTLTDDFAQHLFAFHDRRGRFLDRFTRVSFPFPFTWTIFSAFQWSKMSETSKWKKLLLWLFSFLDWPVKLTMFYTINNEKFLIIFEPLNVYLNYNAEIQKRHLLD